MNRSERIQAHAAIEGTLCPRGERQPCLFGAASPKAARGRRQGGPGGFTILEAMISAAILLIAISGLLTAFSGLAKTFEHQRHLTPALSIAESAMEGLLLLPASHDDLKNVVHAPRFFDRDGQEVLTPDAYELSWSISGTSYGMRRLTVTVSWEEGSDATPASISLVTDRS